LVDNNQDYYARLYKKADALVRDASGSNDFIISSPRFIMESAGMIFIACMAYVLSLDESEFQTAIPLLGALALGAQRILPALQQAYNGYSTIKGVSESYFDVMKLLEKKCDNGGVEYSGESVAFCNNIELKNVGFKYPGDARWLFNGFNLNIKKGSRVGFVGETGSGKSTLVDIIMGLWIPEKGSMLVDNVPIILDNRRLWQANISHVPQNIFLTDCTVRENIAFGVSEDDIDDARIIESAKKANIHSVIEGLPLKYETLVGERGVRLSGGQRQRLGIARALYKKANVLILDEATSALDNETEEAVMDAIKSLDNSMTIIIVAHRLTTIKDCDMVVNISRNGIITEINGGLK